MADNLLRLKQTEPSQKSLPHDKTKALELKGSTFSSPVLRLQSGDLSLIKNDLSEHLAQSPSFFVNAPVVIDLQLLKHSSKHIDFTRLCQLLRDLRLIPVGMRNGNKLQQDEATEAGLAILKGGKSVKEALTMPAEKQERVEPAPASLLEKPRIVKKLVRSGQQIYAKKQDLIVLAPVNAGAEVIADGNIHIYGPLRGRALAGASGELTARIFIQKMEAELVAIADFYKVIEERLPEQLHAKSIQVYLKNNHLKLVPLN